MIAIAELAKQLARDRSSLSKRIKNNAIPTSLERVKTAGGTQGLRCMSDQDAEKIRRQIQAEDALGKPREEPVWAGDFQIAEDAPYWRVWDACDPHFLRFPTKKEAVEYATREVRVMEFCSVLLHLLTILPHLDSGDLERVRDAIKVLRPPSSGEHPPLKGNMICDRCGNRFDAGDATWNPTIASLFLCEECWENGRNAKKR